MNWIECIILFAVALGVTIALTPLARRLAIALDAIDYPSARRVNMQPIPRMGGVAIFGGMVAALALALVGAHFWGWTTPLQGGLGNKVNWIGVAVGILIMFGVGIVDDIYNLKPKAKLLGQIVAACVVAFSGLLFSSIHNFISDGYFEFGWLSYPLTVFYLVAFANIINLIDGLDGLAAGITAITAATIGILAVLTWRPGAALASFVIVGACIGFLKSNIHPASIFMGILARCSWASRSASSLLWQLLVQRSSFPCWFPSSQLVCLFWTQPSPSFVANARINRSTRLIAGTFTIVSCRRVTRRRQPSTSCGAGPLCFRRARSW